MYRPGEVINPDPLGYSRMQSPFLFSFFLGSCRLGNEREKKKKKSQQFHFPENNTGRVSEDLTKPGDF